MVKEAGRETGGRRIVREEFLQFVWVERGLGGCFFESSALRTLWSVMPYGSFVKVPTFFALIVGDRDSASAEEELRLYRGNGAVHPSNGDEDEDVGYVASPSKKSRKREQQQLTQTQSPHEALPHPSSHIPNATHQEASTLPSANELRWFEQFAAQHGLSFSANEFDVPGFNPYSGASGARTVAHRGGGGGAFRNPFGGHDSSSNMSPQHQPKSSKAKSSGLQFDLSAFALGDHGVDLNHTQSSVLSRSSASIGEDVAGESDGDEQFSPFQAPSSSHANPQTSSARHRRLQSSGTYGSVRLTVLLFFPVVCFSFVALLLDCFGFLLCVDV